MPSLFVGGVRDREITSDDEREFVRIRNFYFGVDDLKWKKVVSSFCDRTLYLAERAYGAHVKHVPDYLQGDFASDVLFGHVRCAQKFKAKSSFYTNLYRMALNKMLNLLKKEKTHRKRELPNEYLEFMEGFDVNEVDGVSTPLEELLAKEERQIFDAHFPASLSKLSETQKKVINLRFDGLDLNEIARVTGIERGTVGSAYFYGMNALVGMLSCVRR